MSNKTSPTAVSARLKKAGFGIVATYSREGIRVRNDGARNNGKVCIAVDLNSETEAARLADLVAEELATWDGFDVRRSGVVHFYLAKTAPADEAAPATDVHPTAETHDVRKAWEFVCDVYDNGRNYSPTRGEWTDAEILAFVAEHHVDGTDAFKL